jgi:hypothetical protein
MSENKFASIQALEGGFIVELGDSVQVTTSFNKAMKLIRDYIGAQATEE